MPSHCGHSEMTLLPTTGPSTLPSTPSPGASPRQCLLGDTWASGTQTERERGPPTEGGGAPGEGQHGEVPC